jgi:UDP-N-acetylglucosamine 4,6-dehydratase
MSTYLVTGGAGSLGKILCDKLIQKGHRVRAMDINEAALASMVYPAEKFTKIYGDISDERRVYKALRGVDVVIHCAAMKNLLVTEWNAEDCVRINILGTQHIAEQSVERKVKQCIFISSDKAVECSNLYGATKLAGEQLWKAQARRQNNTIFTIIRSGNFFESAGNCFEIWDKCIAENKPLPITDTEMERYFIEASDVADIAIDLPLNYEMNGAVVIPFMKKYNILTLVLAKYGEETPFIITGKRQGEKITEKLKYDDEQTIFICNAYTVVK